MRKTNKKFKTVMEFITIVIFYISMVVYWFALDSGESFKMKTFVFLYQMLFVIRSIL